MLLEPPRAKKAACWRRRVVVESSRGKSDVEGCEGGGVGCSVGDVNVDVDVDGRLESGVVEGEVTVVVMGVGSEDAEGESRESRRRCCRLKSRKRGMLVARDWVSARRV
jgi:hypothetical protein